ncbi:MAG: tRNA (guanosine(46)-N7)-methyltransferase TrmB [Erysipelothrix sp.]|nr:tRNA (guanosine(46)-N7)-methyltransferase TrmB [Erysipelothrix sp.]
MRARKKPWTQEVLQEAMEQDLLIKEPEQLKGKWKKHLQTNSLHVEIGSGKGDYFVGMSSLYPEEGWVGIEKDSVIAGYALRKSFGVIGNNGKFINDDTIKIDLWFNENEIDVIHLNFSDPWPKKAHHKRRLTTPSFGQTYQTLLKNGGQIILKSDNQQFFEDSLVVLSKSFELEDIWVDFRSKEHPEDIISEYEQRFIDLGQPIYRSIWRNRK